MAAKKQAVKSPVNRVFKGEKEVNHDLYKLEVALMKKNVGLQSRPRWEDVEHAHFFHSYDSNGRKMQYCSSIGGHCHEIIEGVDENGNLTAKCGKPVYKQNRNSRAEVLSHEDNHTHEVTYLESEKITTRKHNAHALSAAQAMTGPTDV